MRKIITNTDYEKLFPPTVMGTYELYRKMVGTDLKTSAK